MTQGSIFDALARNTDPETSHDAADSLPAAKLTALIDAILGELRRHRGPVYFKDLEGETVVVQNVVGATALEVAEALGDGYGIQTVSPRFAPLLRKGWVRIVGKRKNDTGRAANVYQDTGGRS